MSRYTCTDTARVVAEALVADLGNGPTTQNGDRSSSYMILATDQTGERTTSVALIENKAFLEPNEWFYALHIIDDIRYRLCELRTLDDLSLDGVVSELEAIIAQLQNS